MTITKEIEQAVAMTKELYKTQPCGGPLHIVSDDDNLGNEDIRYCFDYAKGWGNAHERYLVHSILILLAKMNYADRYKYTCAFWGNDCDIDPFDLVIVIDMTKKASPSGEAG